MFNAMKSLPRSLCGSMLVGVMVLVVVGCSNDNNEKSNCPSTNDNVTWDSYGRYGLRGVGNDSAARDIVANCGWHVSSTHNGGYGNTLQIASPNEEVIFVWAYNSFYAYKLSSGWRGHTAEGLRMNDDMNIFFSLYPYARQIGYLTYSIPGPVNVYGTTRSIIVTFSNTGFVESILVGEYFRN